MTSTDVQLPAPGPSGWWQVSDEDLAAALRAAEELRNRAEAVQAQVLAEVRSRGVFATYGYPSLEAWQRDLLRISTAEAKRRARRAELLHPVREGTSEPAAAAPLTADAATEGGLNPGHVDAIVEVMAAIPAEIAATERAGYEKVLVDLARQAPPMVVRRAGRHLLARLDPDGREPRDDALAEPERELVYSWTRDNRLKLRATLDAEAGQLLEPLLSALAKPRPQVDGLPDQRSRGQRQGDAFAELLEYTQRAAERPTEGGETPVVTVSMTLDQLLGRDPSGSSEQADQMSFIDMPTLNWECPVTAEQARRLACDARLVPAVLGANGEILDLGRETRTATKAQRRALAQRDGGCVMCSRTVRWVPGTPHPALAARRCVRYGQPVPTLLRVSPPSSPRRLGHPHGRRWQAGSPTARMARPGTRTSALHRAARRTLALRRASTTGHGYPRPAPLAAAQPRAQPLSAVANGLPGRMSRSTGERPTWTTGPGQGIRPGRTGRGS